MFTVGLCLASKTHPRLTQTVLGPDFTQELIGNHRKLLDKYRQIIVFLTLFGYLLINYCLNWLINTLELLLLLLLLILFSAN